MKAVIGRLEERVDAVGALVQRLRADVARLEREIAECPAPTPALPAAPGTPGDSLLEEIATLRAERAAVRERIRALIKEIDQVSW